MILMKKGTRCTICTGCGRCFGEFEKKINILSFSDADIRDAKKPDAAKSKAASLPAPVICTDIGTTTIAMVLLDKDGKALDSYTAVNPQGKYGADVLSRIKAASDPGSLEDMKHLVRDVLKDGVRKFAGFLKVSDPSTGHATDHTSVSFGDPVGDRTTDTGSDTVADTVEDMCVSPEMYIAANTTMVYLLMGYDPSELGSAPFTASHTDGEDFQLESQGLKVNCHVLPGFSAFVGPDIYAGILATEMAGSEDYTLLCDLGTNGEIALGNSEKLYVTATAAGPAFEGGPLKGIWGADIIKIAALMLKEGKMDRTGLLSDPYFEKGITAGNVNLTQDSIRALQLAKGAMKAGIDIICKKAGINFHDISRCILSGGFGYYLDPEDAAEINLLPSELLGICTAGGNTALSGCLYYALGKRVNKKAEVINLADESGFNDLYMNSLNF